VTSFSPAHPTSSRHAIQPSPGTPRCGHRPSCAMSEKKERITRCDMCYGAASWDANNQIVALVLRTSMV
jgi:hypothetical protein